MSVQDPNNLLDPRNPKSPYNRYNWDSPYSVANPNSAHYDPNAHAAHLNAWLITVFLAIIGGIFGYLRSGSVPREFVNIYEDFKKFRLVFVFFVIFLAASYVAYWLQKYLPIILGENRFVFKMIVLSVMVSFLGVEIGGWVSTGESPILWILLELPRLIYSGS